MTHLENTQMNIPPGVIDLGAGNPQFELLPLELLQGAAQRVLSRSDRSFLQYGRESGFPPLRQALAQFLGQEAYGFSVDTNSLFITNGSSQGLDLICTLFTRPGDRVLVEEPTYFLALRVLADHGLQITSIPVDAEGLDVQALEAELQRAPARMLYTVPTFQNPSGVTLSPERRQKLAELSQAYDLLVVADEVYHCLGYSQQPPRPLAAFAQDPAGYASNFFSLGSFSKILAPGLRLGWIQAHPARVQALAGCGLLDSGGGLNPFTSAIVADLIQRGDLTENIAHLRRVYAQRVTVMDRALQQYLPQAEYRRPHGGFFFWVRLPGGLKAESLQDLAAEHKVGFRPGARFSSRCELDAYVRLGFSFYPEADIEEGIYRLGRVVSQAL